MNNLEFRERRRYPRIEKKLPLKISSDEYDIITQTKNISCIGAYCSVNRSIPVLTKLSIILLLPSASKRHPNIKIKCKGVVVRTERDPSGNFNIAIFFNEISKNQKDKISKYVNQHLNYGKDRKTSFG
ncbi:MAG: PilZ domain-containing protein [Candidatus Omnitrophica bacterium]|nr:PilZ domain-containing protein [Candidatus Omnitrophota bacterium]